MADMLVERVVDVVLEESAPQEIIVTEAVQGPPGPRGPAGPSGGSSIVATAGSDVGGHRLVYLDAFGAARYADARTPSHAAIVLGMTIGAATAGAALDVVRVGEVEEPSWSWAPGMPVFLGVDGVPTQSLPATAAFSLVVGFAISATRLFVSIREPVILS